MSNLIRIYLRSGFKAFSNKPVISNSSHEKFKSRVQQMLAHGLIFGSVAFIKLHH